MLWTLTLALAHPAFVPGVCASESAASGQKIYQDLCVKCHGASGEGVAGEYDEPLSGDKSIEALARIIHKTMPDDAPEKCIDADAAKVAAYIYDAFYSPEARARLHPPRVELARLTVRQYLNSVADLIASFRPDPETDASRGLPGEYFKVRNFKRDERVMERIDPRIGFQFGESSPDPEKIEPAEFSIRWRGSILADETGAYEFRLRTENGARLWINGDEAPLIDAWVSSGADVREHAESIHLIGGRAYPIRVEFFKFKEKSASLELLWKPPHKAIEVIPERHLTHNRVPETMVVTAVFPPDDSSVGYERGSSVSKAWDQAATAAAIETAHYVAEHLKDLTGCDMDPPEEWRDCLEEVCASFVRRAFHRPLSDEERQFYVGRHFDQERDDKKAIKRVVLLTLKSPRFLYPGLGAEAADDFEVAARLSYGLWDSLPDDALWEAATHGLLRTPEQVADQARRMLKDPRTRAKVRYFFHQWLEMDEAADISKDPDSYPDFDELVLSDLRSSLDLFLEQVVWSETSDYRQILLADYLLLNQRLARFYGLESGGEHGFEKVTFDPAQRAGVVTHPYLLSAFAYHKSSSPIHRGVFLTRNMLGRALKPPPMAIEFMDDRFSPELTMRQKVAELTRSEACQTCHSVINPLGFSLEHYDAVGRYRTEENNKPVDASSDYTTADGKVVRLTGARDVAQFAATSEEAQRGFIEHLFHQMIKQPVRAYGPETLDRLHRHFVASEFHIQNLLVEMLTLSALHHIQPEPGNPHENVPASTIHP